MVISSQEVNDFEIINHPALGHCYKKIDDNDVYIPFQENEFGLNYGQYIKDYISRLHPKCSWLMTKPRKADYSDVRERLGKFHIWYSQNKTGKNVITTAMAELSLALELPKYLNCQISVIKVDATEHEVEEQDPLAHPQSKKIKIEIEESIFPTEMSNETDQHFVFVNDNS